MRIKLDNSRGIWLLAIDPLSVINVRPGISFDVDAVEFRIDTLERSKHLIKRAVLQHENYDMLDGIIGTPARVAHHH